MVKVTTGVRVYPQRALAKIALADGVISENDYLLQSLFYLVGGLEDWLSKTIHPRFAERPNWVT